MVQTDRQTDIPTVKIKIRDEQQIVENYMVWQLQRTLIVLVFWEFSFQILDIILHIV